jgi:hypothetical protein
MAEATIPGLELARRVLEREKNESGGTAADAAVSAAEKLRGHLTKFVGGAGFHALLARALALARAEVPWLQRVELKPDGTLEGLREAMVRLPDETAENEAAILLAHLVGLLVVFVGDQITLSLVQGVWPGVGAGDVQVAAEESRH